MIIKDIKLVPAGNYLFVQVYTDNGLVGLGEVGVWGYLDAAASVINKFKKYLLGQDPLNIEHHWQSMYRPLYFRGSIVQSAIAAIDIALWDIKGKHLDVPVYQLLGGQCRNKVRTYVPVFEFEANAMAEGCRKAQEQGYTAARLIIPSIDNENGNINDETFCGKIEIAVQKIKACRQAVGSKFDLCIEIHRSMSVADSDSIEIEVYMAGGGCSLPGRATTLMPSAGYEGIVRYVFDTIVNWGINACPPLLVGIGIAGSVENAAVLSKMALLRPLGTSNPNPKGAEMEKLLEKGLNQLGLGPQGLSGSSTVMGIHIESAARHPSTISVGISVGCWAHRKGTIRFDKELNYEIASHKGVSL